MHPTGVTPASVPHQKLSDDQRPGVYSCGERELMESLPRMKTRLLLTAAVAMLLFLQPSSRAVSKLQPAPPSPNHWRPGSKRRKQEVP